MGPVMHRHFKLGIAISMLAVALLLALPATAALAQGSPSGEIMGQVTDKATGEPVAGIRVDALLPSGAALESASAFTDSSGYYDISELAAGTYRVLFQDSSGYYGLQYYKSKWTFMSSTVVMLRTGTVRTGIDAALVEAAHITGYVTSKATGDPVAGVRIDALLPDGTSLSSLHAFTDSSGYYDVGGLAGGAYKVLFQDGSGYYGWQYYKAKTTLEAAAPLTLRAGGLKEGIDVALVEAAHIAGRVTNKVTGDPVAGIRVDALLPDGSSMSSLHAFTDTSGYYDVGGLVAGSYRVAFVDESGYYARQYSDHKPILALSDRVTLASGAKADGMDATLVQAETQAPVTTDDAPAGWLTNGVNVRLTPTDADSGVFATYFRLNGGAVQTYTGPIAVFGQGVNVVEYWSIDWAGNVEAAHNAVVVVFAPPASNGTPSAPSTPASVKHGVAFTIVGTIVKHAAGSSPVTLQFYRSEHGRWTLRKSTTAKASGVDGVGFSKYSDSTSLALTGQWRVRAMHKAGSHILYSGYRNFTIS
jgi:5-hydroxyisourate hydrolase-like protein (transthyretin family)